MTKLQMENMKTKRDQCISALARIKTFIDTITVTDITKRQIFELKSRLNRLPAIWEQFDIAQSYLESKSLLENEVRVKFEDEFYSRQAELQEIIDEFQNSTSTPIELCQNQTNKNPNSFMPLQPIKLPTFSGNYQDWLEFRDSFCTLVHANSKLTNIEKFYHLKFCLKDEVLDTIKSIPVTSDNYHIAWQQLIDRYEKTHLIANNHVNAILKHPQISKDSSKALRYLHNSIKNNLAALKNLKVPIEHWDLLLIPIISAKLDSVTVREWERCTVEKKQITLQNLLDLINNRADFLEKLENKPTFQNVQGQQINKGFSKFQNTKNIVVNHVQSLENKCKICNEPYHPPFNCDSLLKATIKDRLEKVKKAGLCLNCLKPNHFSQQCQSSKCKKCNKSHNTLLHFESKSQPKIHDSNTQLESASVAMTQIHCNEGSKILNQVLLPTAIIELEDKQQRKHRCRALLDSGAMSNFISTELCDKLGLQKIPVQCSISGVGQSIQKTHFMTKIQLKLPCDTVTPIQATCLVMDKITSHLPICSFNLNKLQIPNKIKLADPEFNKSSKIDILLGSSVFWDLLLKGQIKIPKTNLTLQETKLGWIVGGRFTKDSNKRSINNHSVDCLVTFQETIENQLKRFWEIEEVENKITMSPDDQYCETFFEKTHSRSKDGHYIVQIPFKSNLKQLGASRDAALMRFYKLEQKLAKNKELHSEYSKTIQEYQAMNHMKEIKENLSSERACYYIPHHVVVRHDSLTTKTRVVFDASMKSNSGISLNDVQYTGPTIQNELFSILTNFRLHKYMISGDISKMYRMIWLHDNDKPYHRIFWRENSNDSLKCFELQTVTFGTASAPYLAIRCLKQIAIEHEKTYPKASQIIKNNFYVDDLLFGTETISELIQLQHEICSILASAGFNLRKWLANDNDIYNKLRLNHDMECNTLQFGDKNNKTLGIIWNAQQDNILYSNIKINQTTVVTKRMVLSELSKFFDPLGLLGPIITVGKLLMQQLWQKNITWDNPLSTEYVSQWLSFRREISKIPDIKIKRRVLIDEYTSVELHGFSDASERAYGAAVFIKSKNRQGHVQTSLLCSKGKVAPLKIISIAKLELCGALLLAKLVNKVLKTLEVKIDHKYYWTDSTITLAWIKSQPGRWKTFVANRVSAIQELTNVDDWHHVLSADNPADLLSRGVTVDKLINNQLWWSGPSFIKSDECSVHTDPENPKHIPEEKSKMVVNHTITVAEPLTSIIEKFSSFKKLLRTITYCLRFTNNCQKPFSQRSFGELSVKELNGGTNVLIRLMQQESFPDDYRNLIANKPLNTKSNLAQLNPFLDEVQIIRVGGRLDKSQLGFESKHPIILSPTHHLSKLIIKQIHSDNFHCGPTTLLAIIRQRYWPIRGRNLIRGITRKCKICFLAKPKASTYIMGQLPSERISQAFPFQNVGVDYTGPILIKDRKTRNYKTLKSYICLFVCMASKAIHLECVTELSTDGFLACLRRFVSRRGKPSNIYSDNGTNFVGANNEIKQFYNFIRERSNPIQNFLAHEQISWHFIPARSPTFGGVWEAGIKNVKTYLHKIMRNTKFHYEDLNTILCQIEAIVNSRPLTPLTSDPSDLTPLTPGHFLIGRSFTQHPEINSNYNPNASRLKNFQMMTQIINQFWRRWSAEYVSQLQIRTKWQRHNKTDQALQVGKMVLVKEDNTSPLQWPLGRITQLHPGTDGVVRTASIQLRHSVVKRGVSKICVLPED